MRTIIVSTLVILSLTGSAFAQTRVPVYVSTVATASNLSDPSQQRLDSLADLQKTIRKSKVLTLAETADTAVIVLTVLDRDSTWTHTGTTQVMGALFGGYGRQRMRSVTVQLAAGDLTAELTATKGKYKQAAGELVKQVERWTVKNREQLATLTASHPRR